MNLFKLGQLAITPNALEVLKRNEQNPSEFLVRHVQGDWGDLCQTDCDENAKALLNKQRLLSSYNLNDDEKIWIITEADRSVTTVLLPSDY